MNKWHVAIYGENILRLKSSLSKFGLQSFGMKHEFVTLYGKAVIERDVVYIRSVDIPLSKTSLAIISYNLLWIVVFVMQFFREEGPRKYIGIVLFGVLFLSRFREVYDALIKRSYASRIPLDRIRSVTIEEQEHIGLNVDVILHLKSGRYKKIVFRKLEGQYQPFIGLVSQHIAQPQPA